MPDVTTRVLTPADAHIFRELRLFALAESPTAFVSTVEEERDLSEAEFGQRLVPDENQCIAGAFDSGRLVAVAGVHRERKRKERHKVLLWGVFVRPECRGAGVGRRVVTFALERAREMPALQIVYLGVNAANAPAIALYESLGFTAFGLERGFMIVDGVLQDELHMSRRVALPDGA